MDCIENCKVIDKFHDDELALRKDFAEVKEERDRLQLILKADSEHIVEIEAERDRYRDALEDCRPHEHRDDCRWPCTCGKDKADTALEASDDLE